MKYCPECGKPISEASKTNNDEIEQLKKKIKLLKDEIIALQKHTGYGYYGDGGTIV